MLYYRQKENGYKEEVDDDSKKIMGDRANESNGPDGNRTRDLRRDRAT